MSNQCKRCRCRVAKTKLICDDCATRLIQVEEEHQQLMATIARALAPALLNELTEQIKDIAFTEVSSRLSVDHEYIDDTRLVSNVYLT